MKKFTTQEIERLSVGEFKEQEKLPVVVVLDNIRSQHNIGSVFRTSDAFRIESLHLCGITATPPSREIHKTALGATESVDWKYFATTAESLKSLKDLGYVIVAVEQASESVKVHEYIPKEGQKTAIILGNEVHGVDDDIMDMADICVEIPQYGTKHSLNVAVSAGIVLWEFIKKRIN